MENSDKSTGLQSIIVKLVPIRLKLHKQFRQKNVVYYLSEQLVDCFRPVMIFQVFFG